MAADCALAAVRSSPLVISSHVAIFPAIVGVFTGTNLGTRVLERTKAQQVRFLFAVFLAIIGVLMALRATGFGVVV